MNVFLFELKRTFKSATTWTVVLIALLFLLMDATYPLYQNSRVDVEAILAGFPPSFSALFGISVDTIFSYGGFYAFGFLYLSLIGTIMAALLGLDIFSRESRSKCQDFLLTKPRSRTSLFCAKLLAALATLVLSNVLYILASFLAYRIAGQTGAPIGNIALAASALFFTELVMFSVSVCTAVFAKRVRSVSGTATIIAFGGFILTALQSILQIDELRYIAPYKYFNVSLAFSEGHFETRYAVAAAVITVLLLAISFIHYHRVDIPAS